METDFSLYDNCAMLLYNKEVRENCVPFNCGESDLDDFFLNDAELYADLLLDNSRKTSSFGCAFYLI